MVAVFDWAAPPKKAGKPNPPVAHGKSTRAKILSININPAGNQIVATCVKELSFMTFANGVIKSKKGTGWGKKGPESVLCQTFVGDTLFTGSFTGDVIAWNGNSLGKRNKGHTARVNCLYSKGNQVVSGSHDGKVIVWNANGTTLQPTNTIELTSQALNSMDPKATSVCLGAQSVLIGTRGGEIIEAGIGAGTQPVVRMRAHFDSELWGLAMHPTKAEMITVGRDSMLAVWDIPSRR